MGVPAELLGKQVRCPHCKQVVLAPVTAGPAPAPAAVAPPAPPPPAPVLQPPPPAPMPEPQPVAVAPPPAPVPVPPPPPVPEPDLPVFNIPVRKEGADSILSEPNESDDEVFGSHPGIRLPVLPPLDATPPPAPAPVSPPAHSPAPVSASPFAFDTGPIAVPPPVPAPVAVAPIPAPAPPPAPVWVAPAPAPLPPPPAQPPAPAMGSPFADLEPVSLPAAFASAPVALQPVAAPAPLPLIAAPQPAPPPAVALAPVGGNPFADFDAEPTAPSTATVPGAPRPAPAPVAEELLDEEPPPRRKKREDSDQPPEKTTRAGRPRAATGGGVNPVILYVVAGYAFLATALAVYGLFFKSGVDTGHPLSTIPDNFCEFAPAARKKVTKYRFPVDGELPADQRAGLGGKVAVGELEVTPVRIEKRRLKIITEPVKGQPREEVTQHPAFVLTLSIKNTSGDLDIYPMDPAFTRKGAEDDKPITRLVVNKQTVFAGGWIPWPPDPDKIKKRSEVQQKNDYEPLRPNETREYVVFTEASAAVVKAVEGAKEPLQWRVEVRRGPVALRGKEIPVTAIVGVDFKASDVKPD